MLFYGDIKMDITGIVKLLAIMIIVPIAAGMAILGLIHVMIFKNWRNK